MLDIRTKKAKKGAHAVKKAEKTAAPKAKKKTFRVPLAAKIAGGVLALLLVALCAFTYLYPYVFPGVTVGSISVSGLSRSDAEEKIRREGPTLYEGEDVSVKIYETTYDIPVDDVLQNVDSAQSAENAFSVGRRGNPFSRMWNVVKAAVGKNEAQMAATVDEEGLTKALEDIAAEALTEPVEPTWEIGTDTMTIYAGKPGVNFNAKAIEQVLAEKIRLMDFAPYEVSVELSEIPPIDIDKIAEQVIGDPVSATVSKEDGKTIIPEKVGVQFDVEEARGIIGDGSAASYTIPVTTTAVKVTAADLEEKLFRDTLASCSTNLSESNVPRTNNVRLASAAINGTILNPGDEFSYNDVVGERTPERGYQSAGAYSGNEIIDEVGGGVCQPSSTLYMAVLRADLEVTERVNHSFTVSYTPLGEDATVSWGGPDFKFKNNTDYPVKILAEQTDGQMIMTIVGTKTSDKTVSTRTEVLETYSPQRIEKKDNSMKVGETRKAVSGITGYSTRTYKIITENGQTTEVLANTSNYIKRDEVVYVGTIQPTPAQPETPPAETPQEETQQPESGAQQGESQPSAQAAEETT